MTDYAVLAIMDVLLAISEDSATLRSDMSAVYGVWQESDVVSIALFFCCTITITLLENQNALNLGSGQSPVSRRLLSQISCKPFRFRMDSLPPMTMV